MSGLVHEPRIYRMHYERHIPVGTIDKKLNIRKGTSRAAIVESWGRSELERIKIARKGRTWDN